MVQQDEKLISRPFGKFGLLALGLAFCVSAPSAQSIGIMTPHVMSGISPRLIHYRHLPIKQRFSPTRKAQPARAIHAASPRSTKKVAKAQESKKERKKKAVVAKAAPSKPIQPQRFADSMTSETLAPGVVHRFCRGPLSIHVIDVDMKRAPVKVQPNLAGESFDRLKDVAEHARESNAIAAVNANYFKTNGTPLGTLIINGEWIAGPLYDRVSMGITENGSVKIDRVSLKGTLTSDNPEVPSVWLNNINQPRRHGAHLVVYTRRWGQFVRMPYAGCLVAVNNQGQVQDKSTTVMGVPLGGYVLSDSKNSQISKLNRGDKVEIAWHTGPNDWSDVVQAVSGGPMLIKNGQVFLDLKDENFRRGWTGSQIHARTAAGVTGDNHLLLATIEGPHTLWDMAKFLHKLGAVDAMNLDGGGSTTMVVHGNTVTRNATAHQRHVASSIVVLDMRNAQNRNSQDAAVSNLFRNTLLESAPALTSFEGDLTSDQALLRGKSTEAQEGATAAPQAILAPAEVPAYLLRPVTQEAIQPPKKHKRWFGLLH